MGSMPWKRALMDLWEDEFAGRRVEVVRPGTVYDRLGRPTRPKPVRVEGLFEGQGSYKWRPVVFVDALSVAVEKGMAVRAIDEPMEGLGRDEAAVYGAVVRLHAREPGSVRTRAEAAFTAAAISRELVRAGVIPPPDVTRFELALGDLVEGGRLERTPTAEGDELRWRVAQGAELRPMLPRCPACWAPASAAHAQTITREFVGGRRTSGPGVVTYECQRGHFHDGTRWLMGPPDDVLVTGLR